MILLYHRISSVLPDPWRLNVTASRFAEHLAVLREEFTPVTLADWVAAVSTAGAREKPPVAVTFDDGYANNLQLAVPLLEEFEVPATFFVVSGALSGGGELWWDELERIVLLPRTLPPSLELSGAGSHYEWKVEQGEYDPRLHVGWGASDPPPSFRQQLFLELWQILYRAPTGERNEILTQLRAWADVDVLTRPTHRCLLPDEVREIAANDLFEIGAHTATHPSLAALPLNDQRAEIELSRAHLGELLGYPVEDFSYPYGGEDDFSPETVELVASAGFKRACMAVEEARHADFDPYRLPRLYVQNWTGGEFRARLSGRK